MERKDVIRFYNAKVILGFYFLCFVAFSTKAQITTIQGYAPYYKGKTVYVSTDKDFITYIPRQLASTNVNDSGKFTFQLDSLNHYTHIDISIDNYNADMYASPGNLYQVEFPAPDSDHYQNSYVQHSVNLIFFIHDTLELNSLIMDFNDQFDKYWVRNYQYFVKGDASHSLDSFYNAMSARYKSINNPDFSGYMTYSIAEMESNILEGQKTLGEKYIQGKPILYNNYEYMEFFNDYFKGYMQNFTFSMEGGDINKFIDKVDYPDLVAVMKINQLLRNDSLCELVILKGLYEFYYSGNYDKEDIKLLLQTIALSTKIDEDRLIAQDMLESFSGVIKGGDAPDFALKTSQGDISSILDYRGKYTYIAFFKTNSTASVGQMEVVPALYKQYKKKINFVFICEDENYSDLTNFLSANKTFVWTFLWDEKHQIMQKYGVKNLPEYFLITPQGKFFRSPADDPSHGIETTFDDITKPVKEDK